MGAYYGEQPEFVPHNINNSVATLGGKKITDIDSIVAAHDDDEVSIVKVASGTAIDNEHPSESGKVTITILEASASTDIFEDARAARNKQKYSFMDSAAPKLDVNGRCRIQKGADINREGEATKSVWILTFTYLKMRGGSYAIAQSE